nr:response regulator [uncultured Holophaga sp.]
MKKLPGLSAAAPALRIAIIYAIVAGLWIFTSDSLMGLLVPDPGTLTRIATYKGLAFVAITALMLYGLIRHTLVQLARQEPEPAPTPDPGRSPRMLWPKLIFLVILVFILSAGGLVVHFQRKGLRQSEQYKLSRIADFKSRQLDNWVESGIREADYAASGSFLSRVAREWFRQGGNSGEGQRMIQSRLADLMAAGQHRSVFLRDAGGRVRAQAGFPEPAPWMDTEALSAIRGGITLTIPELRPHSPPLVHLFAPMVLPGKDGNPEVIGCLQVVMDAGQKVVPDLESGLRDALATEILLVGRLEGSPVLLTPDLQAPGGSGNPQLLEALLSKGASPDLAGSGHLAAVAWSARTGWGVVATEDPELLFRSTRRLIWYVIVLGAIFVATGTVILILWLRLQRSLYEQLQRRQSLERELLEKRLDNLSRFANDIVLLIDETGRILDANDRACSAYGYPREELLGLSIRDIRAPETIRTFPDQWSDAQREGATRFETLHRRRDGSVFPVEVSSRRVELPDRILVQSIIRDISERKASEEALRQTQKLESLGVLAGGIAHDFNNLLTAILGNLNLAQLRLDREHPAQAYLRNVEKTIQRASDLTRQMLAYSGRGTFEVRANNFNTIVEEMGRLLQVSIPKKSLLVFDLEPGLPPVISDAAQIQQVVMNLVTNAADAIGDAPGTITLRTFSTRVATQQIPSTVPGSHLPSGLYACLEVQDTGCGMSPEVLERIFDPFFSTKITGRGLGLSAMLGILRGHQAGIRIHSHPGAGSRFTLYFHASPEAMLEPERSEAGPEPTAPRRPARILLVDDESIILMSATHALEGAHYQVETAGDGAEALEIFGRRPFQAVVLDLTMPRMDGRETFRRLRELAPDLPVIICSGYSGLEDLIDGHGRPPDRFLPKPYSLRTLEEAVHQILTSRT